MCLKRDIVPIDCIIHRFQSTTDETPPWAGIKFSKPVDSDELSEQLKKAYPELRNLRQRKHMAAIDFLKFELERMKAPYTEILKPLREIGIESDRSDTNSVYEAFPAIARPPSAASGTSSSVASSLPSPHLVERTRESAEQTHIQEPTPSSLPAGAQTFVFSVIDGQPAQQRTKKKMSTEEKRDYKQTRKRGACAKCRKTKAKVPLATLHTRTVLTVSVHSPERICEPTTRHRRPQSGYQKVRPPLSKKQILTSSRNGSSVLDDSQTESTKLVKTEDGVSVRPRSPEALRGHHNDRGSVPPKTARPFRPVGPVTVNGWESGSVPGYVQNISLQESHRNRPLGVQPNAWPFPFDAHPSTDQFNPGYAEGTPQVVGEYYPSASPANNPHEFDLQFSFDSPWMHVPDSQLGGDQT